MWPFLLSISHFFSGEKKLLKGQSNCPEKKDECVWPSQTSSFAPQRSFLPNLEEDRSRPLYLFFLQVQEEAKS